MSRKMIEAFERMRCAEDVCPYCGRRALGYVQIPEGPNSAGNWIHLSRIHGEPSVLCSASAIHARHRFLMTSQHLAGKVSA